ncbi:single-stranded DNA-binding protein [Arthrobacter sp. MA-N2]|uniref:single-stranded DNA-binding protein n=1 Tax=Arthrobacter sp. MA-N2 TaxID=1101188 RepID=UPI0004838A77|nr:single-stranded DNA-binding protein [Arthrobacter sp. MA-N2]
MAQINFTGNLGGEPKMDFKPSGNACLQFRVADTKGKKDDQGNWDKAAEQTQWFRCTLWGPDAEYYFERLRKGARVSVFGDLMAREYVDRDGVHQTSLDVTVRGLSVVNKKGSAATSQPAATNSQGWGNEPAPQQDPWGAQPANAGGWG